MSATSQSAGENAPTGADLLVSALQANGIHSLFGLPGGQLDSLFDAVQRRGSDFRMIRARHEQGAAYMAFGAARSTGNPAAFTVVPGPGILNAMGALATAWGANAPVLSLSGQIPSDAIGLGRGYLHEIPDQLATLRSVLKHAERIRTPHAAPQMVNEGPCRDADRPSWTRSSGNGARCHEQWFSPGYPAPCPGPPRLPCASLSDIQAAADLLVSAKRPLVYAGGGAIHAAIEVRQTRTADRGAGHELSGGTRHRR